MDIGSPLAKHLDLDPKTVKAIDKSALEAEFGETRYERLQRLAIDEIALKKGQNDYMTVVLDYDTGRVVWMGLGHGVPTLDEFFSHIPPTVRRRIQEGRAGGSPAKPTDPAALWKYYIQLTDAEWAFRIEKDELNIRPIWHQKGDRALAHILVCFLAWFEVTSTSPTDR